jgi:hypothetical protein
MSIFTARLEACDPARDCYRSYRLEAGPDLFGIWVVDATYGRIGCRGHTVRRVADDEAQARKIVRHCLQRRATAPKRIGVPYQLRELHDPGRWTLNGISFSVPS